MNTEFMNDRSSEKINWLSMIVLVLFHVGAVNALFLFNWRIFLITVLLYRI